MFQNTPQQGSSCRGLREIRHSLFAHACHAKADSKALTVSHSLGLLSFGLCPDGPSPSPHLFDWNSSLLQTTIC